MSLQNNTPSPPTYIALSVTEEGAASISGDLGLSLSSGSFSLSSWIQYDAFSSNATILSREGEVAFGTLDNGFLFQISGRPPLAWSSPDPLASGWYNVAVTFDNGQARLFVNGDFKRLASVGNGSGPSQKPLMLGRGLQGLLTNVTLFNTTLSPAQVLDFQYESPDPALVAANFDFSQNPPKDLGPKALPITLTPGALPLSVTPGLQLRSTAYARPTQAENINPGGWPVDPYTVQAWVYVDQVTPYQNLFVNSDLDSDSGMSLGLAYDAGTSAFKLVSQRGTGESGPSVVSSTTIQPHTWTNVATTFDGAKLTVFINGVAAGELACGPLPLSRPYGNILIGAGFSETAVGGIDSLQGYISMVEVWSRALSAAEIVQYMGTMPILEAPGLEALFDLTTAPPLNSASGQPVSLVSGARLWRQTVKAPVGGGGAAFQTAPTEPAPVVDAAKLAEWRASVDHTGFLKKHGGLLDAACAADVASLTDPAEIKRVREAYDETKRRLASGTGPEMPLTFTEHIENGRYYLVGHSRRGSYVAYANDAALVDDCTLWQVKLVFIAVAGALDAIFGVSARLSDQAIAFIRGVLNNPVVRAILAQGPAITAGAIFTLLGALYKAGVLRALVTLIVDLGFWSLIRLIAKVLLTFAGVGAADVLASLVATVALFIKTYTERPSSCDPLPTVTLAAIKFNHDPANASVDALSIRVNETTPVTIPEWQTGYTTANQSPAAYAMDQVSGKTVTIQAKFLINTTNTVSMKIQATGGGVLGAIDPVTVNFVNGESNPEYVTLNLTHHTLASGGVRAVDAQWNWQSQPTSGGSWANMVPSNHRIYTLLTQPPMPWRQSSNPAESQLPWTAALDYVCAWASGKTTPDEVLAAVTRKIYTGYGLKYDISHGASFYTTNIGGGLNAFMLTSFLNLLGGGSGSGKIVNCTDCATIVTTFANLAGCDVLASVMGRNGSLSPGFNCNKIIAIGYTAWAYPFPNPSGTSGGFSYHEVVWKSPSSYAEPIYDACLEFDSSNNPWNWSAGAPHTAVLPLNYTFTTQVVPTPLPIATPFTAQTYRERLATNDSNGIGACKPLGQFPGTQSGRRYVI